MSIDTATGEIRDDAPDLALVPLHIAELDEEALASLFPTPQQAVGALIIARERLREAPAVLQQRSSDLKQAKRRLIVAQGMSFVALRREGRTIADARAERDVAPEVQRAQEQVDTCDLALEYAREVRRTLEVEISMLQTLVRYLTGEHHRG